MRHRVKGKKFGRKRGHRRLLTRNLVNSLILYEKIITTEAKGKLVRSETEKMLTIGKKADLSSRRQLLKLLNSKLAVAKIFEDLNSQFKNRDSGFTRIIKVENRKGDNAPKVMVELLIKHKEEKKIEEKTDKKSKQANKKIVKEQKKTGFWDRLRGASPKAKEVKTISKKTIERTTSK